MSEDLKSGLLGATTYGVVTYFLNPGISANPAISLKDVAVLLTCFAVIALGRYYYRHGAEFGSSINGTLMYTLPFFLVFIALKNIGLWQVEAGLTGNRPFVSIAELEANLPGERLTGIAWASPGLGSNLWFRSSTGGSCVGYFDFEAKNAGRAVAECDDGRLGEFKFSLSERLTGTGVGKLGDQDIEFRFRPSLNTREFAAK